MLDRKAEYEHRKTQLVNVFFFLLTKLLIFSTFSILVLFDLINKC